MQKSAQALVAVGLLSRTLPATIELRRILRIQNVLSQTPSVAIPTSTSIPFHLMMDVPLPFFPDAPAKVATCHLATTTTVDFLKDGEWTGLH